MQILNKALLQEDWIREITKITPHGYPYGYYEISQKGRDWLNQKEKDPSLTMLLGKSANMTIDWENEYNYNLQLGNQTSSSQNTPGHNQLPRFPAFTKQWLQRYMTGPCRDDHQPQPNDLLEKTLFIQISNIRNKIAKQQGIQPFHVCSRLVMNVICRVRPTTSTSMIKIEGISRIKTKILEPMMSFLKSFSIENQLQTDMHEEEPKKTPNTFQVNFKRDKNKNK